MVLAVQDVITHIEALRNLHEQLLELARQKKQVLINDQVDELSKIIAQESKLIKKIEEHELGRISAAQQVIDARGFGISATGLSMNDFIKLIPNAEDKQRLQETRNELQAIIVELQSAHALNQELIKNSMSFIHYSLDLLTASPEDDATYSRPEQSRGTSSRSGLFDTRA